MIVICGDLSGPSPGRQLAVEAARRAARDGSAVELVGVVPDDAAGDAVLLELASAGVRHAATLRGPARALEAADLDLALRYLPEIRVVVSVDLASDLAAVASAAAGWSGAEAVVVQAAEQPDSAAEDLPPDAIVVRAPARDPDGTFAGFIGAFAARLDAGQTPADAWAATTAALAVDAV